jgi:hypothetical protein
MPSHQLTVAAWCVQESSGARVGSLEFRDVQLLHGQERSRHTRYLFLRAASKHFVHSLRDDLPGEPVLQPAALLGLGISGELLPVAIDLFLVLAVHHEGD